MNGLRFRDLVDDGLALFRRYGPMAFLDFLAVGIAGTTLQALLTPSAFRARVSDEAVGLADIMLDPAVLVSEAAYALVFGLACLRIWWETAEAPPPPDARRALVARQALPLMTLSVATGYVAYLGLLFMLLPGLMLAAVTTTLPPAILIEGAGWGGLRRAVRMAMPHLFALTAAWAAVLLPWLLVSLAIAPGPAAPEADLGGLWLAWLIPDVAGAVLSAISLCLTMAAYRRIRALEGQARR